MFINSHETRSCPLLRKRHICSLLRLRKWNIQRSPLLRSCYTREVSSLLKLGQVMLKCLKLNIHYEMDKIYFYEYSSSQRFYRPLQSVFYLWFQKNISDDTDDYFQHLFRLNITIVLKSIRYVFLDNFSENWAFIKLLWVKRTIDFLFNFWFLLKIEYFTWSQCYYDLCRISSQ